LVNGRETPLEEFEAVYMQNGELSISPNLLEKYFDVDYSLQYDTKMWMIAP